MNWLKKIFSGKGPAEVDLIMFHQFRPPPFGGGNQFMTALRKVLTERGFRIAENTTKPRATACIFNSFNFDFDHLRRMRKSGCRMIHRVDGPILAYRGFDDGVDGRIAEINSELADVTVFQSEYSLAKTQELGFEFVNPVMIGNAADPEIFHPRGRIEFDRGRKVRLISSSWSDNVNKGGPIYKWLEDNLDRERFEYTFMGRASEEFRWIQAHDPVPSRELADILRNHDIFITASLNDPCSNSVIEALSCGLPVVYLDSGGHSELVGTAGPGFDHQAEIPGVLERLMADYEAYQSRIVPPELDGIVDRYQEIMGLG